MSSVAQSSPMFHRRRNPSNKMHMEKLSKYGLSHLYYYDHSQNKNVLFIIKQTPKENCLIAYDLDCQIIIYQREIPVNKGVSTYAYLNPSSGQIFVICNDAFCYVFDIGSRAFLPIYEYPEAASHAIYTNMVYVPAPTDNMHVITMNNHYQLDVKDLVSANAKQTHVLPLAMLINDISFDNSTYGKMIYIPISHQLFYFPVNCNYILCCDITDLVKNDDDRFYANDPYGYIRLLRSNMDQQPISGWEVSDIPPPCTIPNLSQFDIFLAWNQYMFFFHHVDDRVFCLNLLSNNDEEEWELAANYGQEKMKCIRNSTNIGGDTNDHIIDFAIKDRSDMINLFQLRNTKNLVHLSVDLYRILPMRIRKELEDRNKGKRESFIKCVKYYERKEMFPYFPVCLNQLMFRFYPMFDYN